MLTFARNLTLSQGWDGAWQLMWESTLCAAQYVQLYGSMKNSAAMYVDADVDEEDGVWERLKAGADQ